jgi:cytochrome c biogenesis protein CcmG/thiol:disulfide interchange protein DsbE
VLTVGILLVANLTRSSGDRAGLGDPAPDIVGVTLDGQPFRLSDLQGKPVILNFWGPSCVPCRDEFPLLATKQAEYATDGLAIVGILTDDPPGPAIDFIATYGATWPTVVDPDKAAKTAYRVVGRPQTYFVDPSGVIRSIQVGELTDADFDRQYARIAP